MAGSADLQRRRLPGFLSRLADAVPFYANRLTGVDLGRAASPQVWADVPFTSKDDLRDAQADASPEQPLGDLQAVPMADVVQVLASSGTTGTPVFFGLTEPDRQAWLHSIATMFFTAGIRRTSRVALTTGMPLVAGGMPYADSVRHIGATLVWVGGQTPARMATILDRLQVDTFIGTASYATFAAQRFGEALGRPAADTPMRTIIAGGEPGLGEPTIRERLARVGSHPDQRGHGPRRRAARALGRVPRGWRHALHRRPQRLRRAHRPRRRVIGAVGRGADGEAVYPLHAAGYAVVRFRSRDHLHVQADTCPCGRTSPGSAASGARTTCSSTRR